MVEADDVNKSLNRIQDIRRDLLLSIVTSCQDTCRHRGEACNGDSGAIWKQAAAKKVSDV